MTAVSSYSPTGDPYINGLLSGVKWGVNALTFSFPTSASYYGASYGGGEQNNNFKAFTPMQQTAVRTVLQNYASVANLTFTETTETATQHGELRYAESDSPITAWAYYPSTSAVGGDAWFNNSSHYYDSPAKGNYGYQTLLHETGHALGLKHPQDVRGSFAAIPADRDSLEYTVMSYRSYISGPTSGYTLAASSFPQTLMMYDIATVQTLYGANYNTNGDDTVYKWDPTSGQMSLNGIGQGAPAGNKIFMTIWDGGGRDTYDFSNYATNVSVNLEAGGWSIISTAQLASLGSGRYAAGNVANALPFQGNLASLIEDAIGGSGSDTINGNAASNRLTGNGGNDLLDGGLGTDTAVYFGLRSSYALSQNGDGSWTITDNRTGMPDGTDILKNIELLQFNDILLSIASNIPPANTPPTFTSGLQAASLTEWSDRSASETANTPHTAAGSLTYSDPDATDIHTASYATRATGYLGTFSLNVATIESAHVIGWSFSVADSALDFLTAGQTLTQHYDVTVADGRGGSATQTVTVVISGADDLATQLSPVAVNDTYSVGRNGKLVIAAGAGVLANDVDDASHALSALLVGKPSHGTLKLNADGSFNYTPAKNYVGTDTFSYKVSDGFMSSNVATVTIGVGAAAKGNGAQSLDDDQIPSPYHGSDWHPLIDLGFIGFVPGHFLVA